MAVPTSRAEFKEHCLRRLGKPVIEINVDDDQVEDRIDEALKYYWDYHFDGTDMVYLSHQITADDKTNKYVTVPENVIGAIEVFSIGDPAIRSDDMFNIRYQIALNDLYSLTSVSMIPFYMTMEHLSLVSEMLVGKQPIRYNRHKDRIYVDTNWDNMNVGEYLLFKVYEVVDPDVYTDVWSDRWLQQYTTALIKRQWGNHLTKFENVQLAGGLQYNGTKILDDAVQEINKLEDEMIISYSLPITDMVG